MPKTFQVTDAFEVGNHVYKVQLKLRADVYVLVAAPNISAAVKTAQGLSCTDLIAVKTDNCVTDSLENEGAMSVECTVYCDLFPTER